MADKPILFSGPMVRALIAGTKTQTRRVFKPQPQLLDGMWSVPWGTVSRVWQDGRNPGIIPNWLRIAVGDRLYVRESLAIKSNDQDVLWLGYAADGKDVWPVTQWTRGTKSIPSIHAPRWTSRITLTVTDVRVERLQDISVADAVAEGALATAEVDPFAQVHAIPMYRAIWTGINGPGAWEANPWVAAYTFTVQMGNIDTLARAA